ncbi:MAG: DUF1573 domain-containing protein [Bacteroidales bacterium]|nr:DUF1573 domain-containing protein [Bacteroidales bacterium]MCK9447603.1 DUF1573 domain-containing protein [Bacteroidales bacterium]MDD3701479.1 DUF1573 domain-containing protein [Bacteroidales bacterium]MDY0369206.1 DUF1573 domain-containing protein [Bacteroidales bacterium]
MKKYALLLILSVTAFMVSAQVAEQQATTNGPEITFEKTTHEYGPIFYRGDGAYEFVFTNTGTEPLILNQPRSSCGCTVPSWPRKPILPGEQEKIKVTYNTAIRGRFQKTITVMSNAVKNKHVVLTIKGEVVDKPVETLPEKETAIPTKPNLKEN